MSGDNFDELLLAQAAYSLAMKLDADMRAEECLRGGLRSWEELPSATRSDFVHFVGNTYRELSAQERLRDPVTACAHEWKRVELAVVNGPHGTTWWRCAKCGTVALGPGNVGTTIPDEVRLLVAVGARQR